MNSELVGSPILLLTLYIWSLIIKGIALWRASHLGQKNWFVAILVLNTIGVIELVYLFKFAKKPLTFKEIRSWMPSKNKP